MTADEQCEQTTGEIGAIAVGSITQICDTLKCHTPSLNPGFSYPYEKATLDFTTCGPKQATIRILLYIIKIISSNRYDFQYSDNSNLSNFRKVQVRFFTSNISKTNYLCVCCSGVKTSLVSTMKTPQTSF